MKKLLIILFLTPVFANAQYLHFYTNQITGYTKDSIQIDDKMFYAVPPTLTEAGDIVHKGHLDNALAGISLDSTNYWRTKSDFDIPSTRNIRIPNDISLHFRAKDQTFNMLSLEPSSTGDPSTNVTLQSIDGFGEISALTFNGDQLIYSNTANDAFFYNGEYPITNRLHVPYQGYIEDNFWNSQINTALTGSAITIQQPTSNYDFDFQIGDASTGVNGVRLRVEDHTAASDHNAALIFSDSSRWSIFDNFPSGLNAVLAGNFLGTNKSSAIGAHSDGNIYVGRQNSVFTNTSFGAIMYLENYHANWQDGDNGGTITRDRVIPDIGFVEDSIASKYIPLEGNIVTTDQLIIGVQDNNQLTIQNEAGSSAWQITTIGTNRTVYDIVADSVGTNVHLSVGVDSTSFQDNRTVKRGIEYSQPGIYATKDGSLTDRLTVANMISDSLAVSGTVIREELVNLGAWNMSSATGSLSLAVDISSLNIPVDTAILNVEVVVIHDGGNASYQFLDKLDVAGTCTTCGSVDPFSSATSVTINNESGGFFDSVDFDRTDKNRGYMIIKWREEN